MTTLSPPPQDRSISAPLARWLQLLWEAMRGASAVAVASATAAQSLESGVYAKVNFNVVELDSHGAITTGVDWQWTCPEAGTYELSTSVHLNNAGVAGSTFRVHLTKNQAVAADGGFAGVIIGPTGERYVPGIIPPTAVELVAGDFITVVAFQDNGAAAARDILNGERFTRFMVRRIG